MLCSAGVGVGPLTRRLALCDGATREGEERGGDDRRSSLFEPCVRIRRYTRGCSDAAQVMMLNGTAGQDGNCSFGLLCRRAGGRLLRGATTTTTMMTTTTRGDGRRATKPSSFCLACVEVRQLAGRVALRAHRQRWQRRGSGACFAWLALGLGRKLIGLRCTSRAMARRATMMTTARRATTMARVQWATGNGVVLASLGLHPGRAAGASARTRWRRWQRRGSGDCFARLASGSGR